MHVADDCPNARAEDGANGCVHDSKRETPSEVRTYAECDEQAPCDPKQKDRRDKRERSPDYHTRYETEEDGGGNHGPVTIRSAALNCTLFTG
jgi:hypothetical protein